MPNKIKKRKKKILIEAYKFGTSVQIDGCTRYLNSLLNAIYHEVSDKFDFYLVLNKKIVPFEEAIKEKKLYKAELPSAFYQIRVKANRYFEQFKIIRKTVFSIKTYLFRKKIRKHRFDIVHVLLPHRYYYLKGLSPETIQVMSILDLTCKIVPKFHCDANAETTWSGIVYSAQSCEGIVCISENTRKDYLNYFPDYTRKVAVTHLGYDDKIFYQEHKQDRIEEIKRKYGIISNYYILSLFTLEPRKNLKNLILAFELLRQNRNCNHIELIVAGKVGWKIDNVLKLIKNVEGIRLIGYVHEPDLAPLYSGAATFCYPSFYEGFGLPLLEAMACGTPVVFGNNSSMLEVAGDAGLTCNPDSPKDIMMQLQKILINDDLRSNLSLKSIKQAQQFSWAKCAKETLKLYDTLLD
jgi:glycosyltransferase involved in cell wall biosynthesis